MAMTPLLLVAMQIMYAGYVTRSRVDTIFDRPVEEAYDYIIVGGGTAGSVLAARLTEDPVSVLVLEAGTSELENDYISIPQKATQLQFSDQDWKYYTVNQKQSALALDRKRNYWPVGKVLGGTSCLNYMVHIRGSPTDYDEWATEGCIGWSYKDVVPYFMKSEDLQIAELVNEVYRSTGGPISVTVEPSKPLLEVYKEAASDLGFQTLDCNGPSMMGFCPTQNDISHAERCSTAKCYLRPVLNRKNLQVSLRSHVTRVIINEGRAVGVEFVKNGQQRTVMAKEIILSAGTVASPQILMLSGIGPKEHLEKLKISVEADLPVGNNLQDHMLFFMSYKTNVSLAMNSKNVSNPVELLNYIVNKEGLYAQTGLDGLLFAQLGEEAILRGSPDIEIYFLSVAPDEEGIRHGLNQNIREEILDKIVSNANSSGISFLPSYLHPKSRGTIRLKSTNAFDHPLIDPNYLDDPNDVIGFIRGVRLVQDLVKTSAMQSIGATLIRNDFKGLCDDMPFDSDDYWACYIRYFASTAFHPVGTCRMGDINDTTTVVDPLLRVKGIESLRVVDASVMRSLISGDTNTPTIMIAEKAADLIRGKDTVIHFRYLLDRTFFLKNNL